MHFLLYFLTAVLRGQETSVEITTTTRSLNATAPRASPTPPPCNPYLETCEEYTYGTQYCDQPLTSGALLINSPNASTFFKISQPFLLNISYTSLSNPEYPVRGIWFYYKLEQEQDWKFLINFSNRQTNALVTLTDISPGAYQILGLVDNVDPTKRSKLGVETSCTPDGWPYGSPRAFRMIEGMSVKPYLPGEGVRPNSSTRDGFEIAWIGRWVVSLVLGLFAL